MQKVATQRCCCDSSDNVAVQGFERRLSLTHYCDWRARSSFVGNGKAYCAHDFTALLHTCISTSTHLPSLQTEQVKKQSLYGPGQALRVPGVWGYQISRQMAHEDGKVVSPTHRPTYRLEIFLLLICVSGWVDSRPEGLSKWKIPFT
jgi:hypothetical protein